MARRPALRRQTHLHRHLPLRRNLNALLNKFFKICCNRFGSVVKHPRQRRIEIHAERQALGVGDVTEMRSTDSRNNPKLISSASTVTVPDSIFEQIQNVGDEIEQVRTRRVNVSRKLHLLGREVAAGVFRKLLARIRMELSGVRNSCDMLARNSDLYFRGERQFRRFVFQRSTGLFHFLFLRSTSAFLVGQLTRPSRQFLVRLLQLLLLRLHSTVSCCDCWSNLLCASSLQIVLSTTPMDCGLQRHGT